MKLIKDNFDSLQSHGLNFVFLTDDKEEEMLPFKEMMPEAIRFYRVKSLKGLGIYSIPTTYFFNDRKEIVKKLSGLFQWSDESSVEEVILQMNS